MLNGKLCYAVIFVAVLAIALVCSALVLGVRFASRRTLLTYYVGVYARLLYTCMTMMMLDDDDEPW